MPSVSGHLGVANFDQITTEGSGKYKTDVGKKCVQCDKDFSREKGVGLHEEYARGFHIFRVVFPTSCGLDKLHLIHTECLYKEVKDCTESEFSLYGKTIGRCDEIQKILGDWIKIDKTYHSVHQLVLKCKGGQVEYKCLDGFQRKINVLRQLIDYGSGFKKLYMEASLMLGDVYLDKCRGEKDVDQAIDAFQQVKGLDSTDSSDVLGKIEKAKSQKCEWLVKKAQSDAVMLLEDCFSAVEVIHSEYPGNSVIACYQAELHLLRAKFALDAFGDKSGRLFVLESTYAFFDELISEREKFKKELESLSERKCQELVSIAEQRPECNLSKYFNLLEKLNAFYPKNGNIHSCLAKIAKQHMAEIEKLLNDPVQIDLDILKEAFDSIGFCQKYGGKGQAFKRKVQALSQLYFCPPSGKFDAVLSAVKVGLNSEKPDSEQLMKLSAWFDIIEQQGSRWQQRTLSHLQPRVIRRL